MKKAWDDIKSFVTVTMTIAFIILTFQRVIDGKAFETMFNFIIAFYFGTQFQKKKEEENVKNNK